MRSSIKERDTSKQYTKILNYSWYYYNKCMNRQISSNIGPKQNMINYTVHFGYY